VTPDVSGAGSSAGKLPTAFTAVLQAAVARVPGGRGAVFLDTEGESVDEFTETSRTGIQLVGAHLGVVLSLVRERLRSWGRPDEILIETEHAIILVAAVDDRYLAVLEADAQAPIGLMRRELARAIEALRAEM
jgi:predicted regulator of Ras-like GTPase activity (Roadblock/LC7/MglB family)